MFTHFAGTLSLKMCSASNKNVQEYAEQVFQEEYFDRDTFSLLRCSHRYDKQLCRSMIKEKDILLANFEGRWPEFYGWLVSSGWIRFAVEPKKVNHKVTREFYANAFGGRLQERLG